jgi:aromatic ring-opening dioxygenase LigB subunit
LLDQAGYAGRRELQSVSDLEPAAACVAVGARLASASARVALLVMADGSARRGLKAPGYLDDRSPPFDAEVERAIRAADMSALLALDPVLARELMATGRAAWQVLAGAMTGSQPISEIRYCEDPFGVAYLVASLRVGG